MSVEQYFALRRQLIQAKARGATRDELDDIADRQFDVFDELSVVEQHQVERGLALLLAQERLQTRNIRDARVRVMTIETSQQQTETPDFGCVPMQLVAARENAERLWRLM